MKNSTKKRQLQALLFVLVTILVLGIGYAGVTSVNQTITINSTASAVQENFKVYFTDALITTGTGTASIDDNDATIAYFDVSSLSKAGDSAIVTYTVENNSNAVGASISLLLSNSNPEYFKVTKTLGVNKLQSGNSTTAVIKVEMIKTPITSTETTSITSELHVTPIENASATGGSQQQVISPNS